MTATLLDTSVLTASDERAELDLPETAAISVISLGELHAGVALARDSVTRATRMRRLAGVRSAFLPIDVDDRIAQCYGDVLAAARQEGRTVKATDLLVIATAQATRRELVTLDERQSKLAGAIGQSARVP